MFMNPSPGVFCTAIASTESSARRKPKWNFIHFYEKLFIFLSCATSFSIWELFLLLLGEGWEDASGGRWRGNKSNPEKKKTEEHYIIQISSDTHPTIQLRKKGKHFAKMGSKEREMKHKTTKERGKLFWWCARKKSHFIFFLLVARFFSVTFSPFLWIIHNRSFQFSVMAVR